MENGLNGVSFSLKVFRIQAENNNIKAQKILILNNSMKEKIVDLTHSQHAVRALDFLFEMPIFIGRSFMLRSNIPKATASRIIRLLRDEKWLVTLKESRGRRSAIFAFKEFPNISNVKKLTKFEPAYRYRIGDYRVLFDVDTDKLIIGRVLHRKDSYS